MKKLTDQDKINIVNEYSNKTETTVRALSRKYNVTPPAIKSILIIRGIKIRSDISRLKRKYLLNEEYFEKIDTEAKAYFLGLMYADGCNGKNTRGSYFSAISLTREDSYILEKMRDELFLQKKPLSYTESYKEVREDKEFTVKPSASLNIYSKKISESLTKQGCITRKSLTLKFPTSDQVPNHLIHHFIRGYFDGDGCIFEINKNPNNKNYKIDIISSRDFCVSLQEKLFELGIKSSISHKDKVSNIIFGSKKSIIIFYDFIYKDSSIFLFRKKEIFNKANIHYSTNHYLGGKSFDES